VRQLWRWTVETTRRNWKAPPWVVAVAGLVVFAGCLVYAWSRMAWDISGFVFLGSETRWASDPDFDAVTLRATKPGYDGQACFVIAQAPFADHTNHLDGSFRQTRLLYPLLCYIVTLGQAKLLLWAMPLVNLAMLVLLTWAGAVYSRRWGQSAWWGLLLPITLNALVPATRNLTDLVSFVAVFCLLMGWEGRWKSRWLWLIATAAVLAREQNAVVLVVLILAAFSQRRWKDAIAMLAAGASLLAWMGYLHFVLGVNPLPPSGGNLAAPGVGVLHWINWPSHHIGMRVVRWIYAVFLLGHVGVLLWHVWKDRRIIVVSAMGSLGVLMILVAGPSIADDYWSYTRTLFLLPMSGWMLSVRSGSTFGLVVCAMSIAFVRGTLLTM
jgi:hypothetical protein